jgi:hypothetical protein
MALVPVGGGGGGDDPLVRQMIAARMITGAFGNLRDELADQERQKALGEFLLGRPAEPSALGIRTAGFGGSPEIARGVSTGAPAQPGYLDTGRFDPAAARQFLAAGGDPRDIAAFMPQQGEGFSLSPGEVRYDAQGRQIAQAPGGFEAPKVIDVLEGNERRFLQADPAAPGGWREIGRGPAFAPPTQIHVGEAQVPAGSVLPQAQGPRTMRGVSDVAQALISPQSGKLNTTLLTQFNVPGAGASIPGTEGARLRSAYDEAVNTLIYLQTGKAATDVERDAANAIYLPSPLDSPGEVQDKLTRLQQSLASFVEVSSRGLVGASEAPSVPPIPQASEQPGLVERGLSYLRSALGGGGQAQATPAAPDISGMTLEQLRATALDDSALAQMAPEQRRALAARLRAGGM